MARLYSFPTHQYVDIDNGEAFMNRNPLRHHGLIDIYDDSEWWKAGSSVYWDRDVNSLPCWRCCRSFGPTCYKCLRDLRR